MRRLAILVGVWPIYAYILSMLAVAAAQVLVEGRSGWRTIVEEVRDADLNDVHEMILDPIYWHYFGGPALLVSVTQLVFLWPVCWKRPSMGERGKPLMASFIAAGIVAAGLSTGLFFAVVQALLLIRGDGLALPNIDRGDEMWWLWIGLPLALSWMVWTIAILLFARRRFQPRSLMKLVAWLFAGTLVEVLMVLPLDIMVRRRTNCYCETATAHTLGLAAWALLWLAGPGGGARNHVKTAPALLGNQLPKLRLPKGPASFAPMPRMRLLMGLDLR